MFVDKRKKLMVDMDDVICTDGFLFLINKYLNTNYTYEDFDDFYMQDIISNKEEFFNWFKNQNVYDYCRLNDDCYDVLKELNDVYDLYIGTSYIWREIISESGFVLGQKFGYLQRELPFISPYQYIFISDKSVLDMDIKIDDRIDNLSNCQVKLLFSAYHNKKYSDEYLSSLGIERMNGFKDIKKRLLTKN